MIVLGSCIRIHDRTTKPPKSKIFFCVEPSMLWFLRVNSKDHWGISATILEGESGGTLDRDSFVELSALHSLGNAPFLLARDPERNLGILPRSSLEQLVREACAVPTLTPKQQRAIWQATFGPDEVPPF